MASFGLEKGLDFVLETNPHWREKQNQSFNDLSSYVIKCVETRGGQLTTNKEKALMIEFVHQCNLGEDLGTKSKEETKEILLNGKVHGQTRQEIETINILKALNDIIKLHKDMEGTGLITVQQICDIHKILMTGLHHNAGQIRKTDVYTTTSDGERYFYPSHLIVEDLLYSIIDQHNGHMIKFNSNNSSMTSSEKLLYIVKSAAWLLFNFVDVHPFGDGNGRMCRLLAGYVIMVLNPFPVHPYHKISSNCRQDYINAIVSCRRSSSRSPSLLAALIMDALYDCWQNILK